MSISSYINDDILNSDIPIGCEIHALGDIIKGLEHDAKPILNPDEYTVLRVDGHSFHTFTNGFTKPWDEHISEAMVSASKDWLKEMHGLTVFTQSDEATLVLPPVLQLCYGGKKTKIETLSASFFTARFNYYLQILSQGAHSERKRKKMLGGLAHFDCRAFQTNDRTAIYNIFRWRFLDAFRNGISALARHHYSTKQLNKKNVRQQIKMLNDCEIGMVPAILLYGKWIKKDLVSKMCIDHKTGNPVMALRTKTVRKIKMATSDTLLDWILADYNKASIVPVNDADKVDGEAQKNELEKGAN